MKDRQKGNTSNTLVIGAIVVVVVLLGLYLMSRKVTTPYPTGGQKQVQDELTTISNDLDNTNVDGAIDSELSQHDADAAAL